MSILTDAKNYLVKAALVTVVCSDLRENIIKSSRHYSLIWFSFILIKLIFIPFIAGLTW